MSNLTTGLTQLDDEDRDQVDVVFVTTDPTRDEPQTSCATTSRSTPTATSG